MPEPTTAAAPAASGSPGARRALVLGLVGLTIGAWLLLDAAGVAVPSFARVWPAFFAVGGLGSLIHYVVVSRRPVSLGQAVFGFGIAAVLLPFTMGAWGWAHVLDLLPALPTVVGAAMLVTWLADGRRSGGLLATAVVFLGLGLAGWIARLDWLRAILPSAQMVWAALLLVGGVVVVYRVIALR